MANQPETTNTVRIPSASDEVMLRLMDRIAELSGDARLEMQVLGRPLARVETAEEFLEKNKGDWAQSRLIGRIDVYPIEGARVRFTRGTTSFEGANPRSEPNNWEHEVSVLWDPRNGNPQESTLGEIASIIDNFRRTTLRDTPRTSDEFPLRDVFARQVADLTTLHNKIVRDAEEARQRREEELDQRQRAQDGEAAALRAKLQQEYDELRAQIRQQEAALEARRQELDDRTHMHARRALRESITAELKDRLQRPPVSRSVRIFRVVVFSAGGMLVALLAVFAAQSGAELAVLLNQRSAGGELAYRAWANGLETMAYVLMGRAALAAAGAAAIGFYLLSWARQIHDGDLRGERDLERYLYDIDRATWAIETILEAQKGGAVPDEWISGATHALFARSERRDDEQSQAEALGALLNFAAEAELGPGGTRIKLTKRGINKLRRSGLVAEGEDD